LGFSGYRLPAVIGTFFLLSDKPSSARLSGICNSALNIIEFAIQYNLLGKAQLYSQFKLLTFHFSFFTLHFPTSRLSGMGSQRIASRLISGAWVAGKLKAPAKLSGVIYFF
jgi:hypothetical protein